MARKRAFIKETRPGIVRGLSKVHQAAVRKMAKIATDFGYEIIMTDIPKCPKCDTRMKAIATDEDEGTITFRCETCGHSFTQDESGKRSYVN